MSEKEKPRPLVGVSLLVVFDSSVLLGRRKGSHGAGEYGTPGGHLEFGETFEECALRELVEECGPRVCVTVPQPLAVTSLRSYAGKHYVDIGMVTRWIDGEPQTMEPDKCEGWDFYPFSDLPGPRFAVVDNLIRAYTSGQWYFHG